MRVVHIFINLAMYKFHHHEHLEVFVRNYIYKIVLIVHNNLATEINHIWSFYFALSNKILNYIFFHLDTEYEKNEKKTLPLTIFFLPSCQ